MLKECWMCEGYGRIPGSSRTGECRISGEELRAAGVPVAGPVLVPLAASAERCRWFDLRPAAESRAVLGSEARDEAFGDECCRLDHERRETFAPGAIQ